MIASEEVFERNLHTNTTILVSTNAAGTGIPNNTSKLGNEFQAYENPAQQAAGAISGDGQYVLFESLASNVVPNEVDQNQGLIYPTDIYVRNTLTNTTTLISHELGTTSTTGDNISGGSIMTPSGQYVAFQSRGRRPREQRHKRASDQRLCQPDLRQYDACRHDGGGHGDHGHRRNAQRDCQSGGERHDVQFHLRHQFDPEFGHDHHGPVGAEVGRARESESAILTGLTANTTYYFEVQATSAGGTTDGTILHFTTSAAAATPPAATTVAATAITATGATLNASVNPEGQRHDL